VGIDGRSLPAVAIDRSDAVAAPCMPPKPIATTPEHLLGWPSNPTAPHPFSRRFPEEELRLAEPLAEPLLRASQALGAALFADGAPVEIWQVALEGVRGDDLHALHDAAPPEIAPHLDRLYRDGTGADRSAVASRATWTAGVRTPHGVAALTCGLGTLPYGLALPRDLPA
jgi:hypothetical protein